MRQRSQVGFLLGPVVMLALSAACSQPPESQQVAAEFMDAYYVRMNVKDALAQSSGAARAKLERELQLMEGSEQESGADKPRVTLRLKSSGASSPNSATYAYDVDAHSEAVDKIVVHVTVERQGAEWLVSSFVEDDSSLA